MMSEHPPQQVLHDPAAALPAEDVAAVHAYAGVFCGRPASATDLAVTVLGGQRGPATRLDLLADVRRTAFGWLREGRGGPLRPGFREWARRAAETFGTTDTLRRAEHDTLLLRAFSELAEQSRSALWLCLAEGEPDVATRVLNSSRDFAESMAESARSRLADTFLRLRAEHTTDARCVHYGGMLGAIARGTHRETPADLEQHLETCRFCTHDITLLRTLTAGPPEDLRPLLVDQLLVWGGPEYRAARPPAPGRPDGHRATPERAGRGSRGRPGAWARGALRGREPLRTSPEPPAPATPSLPEAPGSPLPPPLPAPATPAPRRPVLPLAAAVVVMAVATAVTLNLLSDTGTGAAVPSYGPPPSVSQAPPVVSSPSPGADAVLATISLKSAADNGSCVTGVIGASRDNPPVPAACTGGATQQWRVVDIGQGAVNLQHVASTFCLDIAGYRAVGDPMQLRPCAYQQGDSAPYPEDQAFLLKARPDRTFTLVCQDNPAISVGLSNGEVRMLSSATAGEAIRFALDATLAEALGN